MSDLRLAWLGPAPTLGGGVSGVAGVLVGELARHGVAVDVFSAASPDAIPRRLRETPGLQFVHATSGWDWNRWYSRTHLAQFVTGHGARATVQARLTGAIARRHARRPYDFLYQFSQIELFAVRLLRRRLPPIVLHPETHAAGELRWLRHEAPLADRCTPRARNRAVRAIMAARAAVQRADMGLAELIIAISPRFAEHLTDDCGASPRRMVVVPNPVVAPEEGAGAGPPSKRPLKLVFVSRMAVRKGVEMLVALSHDLDDLAGRVAIDLVGAPSLWSDYTPLLEELNPRTACHLGYHHSAELADLYRRAAGLLAPSHFEPFGLAVGEALAHGLPVIASHEVGAAAGVDRRVCHVFPAGDRHAFGQAVRSFVEAAPQRDSELSDLARAEARRLFAPQAVAARIVDALEATRRRR